MTDVELPDSATSRPGRGSPVIRQLVAPKAGRTTQALAALALFAIAGGCVAVLGYSVVTTGDDASLQVLATLATLSVGALIALAGVREKE